MKAMILAAGLGTRLRPLTDTRPKALVEVASRTLLEITLTRLRSFGISEVIINVHHFADMVVDYLRSNNNFGMRIEISREDDLLLDTGGGLKKAAWFFLENAGHLPLVTRHSPTEPFLLHNVDVISTIDINRMLQFHSEQHALATLAVQSRQSSRQLLFNDQLQLVGRRINNQDTLVPSSENTVISSAARNLSSSSGGASAHSNVPADRQSDAVAQAFGPEESASSSHPPLATFHSPLLEPLAFSGIHIISPRLLSMLTEEGVFSIIDSYVRLAGQGEKILAFRADEYYWRDLGRPSDLAQATLDLQQNARLR
jgi:NDP-sugar pyrophosphorylase family protein